MKLVLFSAGLLLIASSNVRATEGLIFSGGGYTLNILIGLAPDPIVGQVQFTPPGAKHWVTLPSELLHIETFDMEKRILTMQFLNKSNPDLPASFSFSVKKTKAVLSISGKEIKDEEFNWEI